MMISMNTDTLIYMRILTDALPMKLIKGDRWRRVRRRRCIRYTALEEHPFSVCIQGKMGMNQVLEVSRTFGRKSKDELFSKFEGPNSGLLTSTWYIRTSDLIRFKR